MCSFVKISTRESVLCCDKSMIVELNRFDFFYKNATIFIFKKMKTSQSCIQLLYSNPIFLDTSNEN